MMKYKKEILILFTVIFLFLNYLAAKAEYSGSANFKNRSYVNWLFRRHEPFEDLDDSILGIWNSSRSGAIRIVKFGKNYKIKWFKYRTKKKKIFYQKWRNGSLSWAIKNRRTGYLVEYFITELGDAGLRVAWRNDHSRNGINIFAKIHAKQNYKDPQISMKNKNRVDYIDKITGMKFVRVKGKCFQMGDLLKEGVGGELHVHKVCLSDYYIGKYEVTQSEWMKIMKYNPSCIRKGGAYPVEQVSWEMANTFIDKLNKKSKQKYRLPTEAEWEYVCRDGGKKVRFGNGKNIASSDDFNFDARREINNPYSRIVKNGKWRKTTTPVGSFLPNSLGIYDLAGNVSEFTYDNYDSNYYYTSPVENPMGSKISTHRSSRGGNWLESVNTQRCTTRTFVKAYYPKGYIKDVTKHGCHARSYYRMFGFRLLRVVE